MKNSCLLCFRRGASIAILLGATAAYGQSSPAPVLQNNTSEDAYPGPYTIPATRAIEATAASDSVLTSRDETTDTAGSSSPTSTGILPDAPSTVETVAATSSSLVWEPPQAPYTATPNIAPKLTKYIPSGWTAQSITGHDKVLIGLKDLYSPLDFIAMIASAGYEQALNGEPNYGTDRGAFGQRLGAAAIRESTQGLFTDSVFSPLFHEDPRYYVQGPSHNFAYRTLYAVTRPFITRTDNGNSSVNGALLAGYAASAALSYTYYPQINRNFRDTASTYGGSLGGAALGFFVSEFSDDLLKAVHMRKK